MKGYRTLIFNAVSILVMVAGALLVYVDRLGLTDEQAAIAGLVATIVVGVGNMCLRAITDTPMGKRNA